MLDQRLRIDHRLDEDRLGRVSHRAPSPLCPVTPRGTRLSRRCLGIALPLSAGTHRGFLPLGGYRSGPRAPRDGGATQARPAVPRGPIRVVELGARDLFELLNRYP